VKKILVLFIVVSVCFIGCKTKKYKENGIYAEINTNKGQIVISLEFERASMTVANFIGLAQGTIKNRAKPEGTPFFDGLKFHRVVPDFVIQAGDPLGTGEGGPGYNFPNEIHTDLKHNSPGIVAMANAGPNTNGSQFYITHKALTHLDNKYSIFGKVIKGMDVVNKTEKGDIIKNIKIIRVGKKAKIFKSDNESFHEMVKKANEKIQKETEFKETEFKMKQDKEFVNTKWPDAITTETCLKYIVIKKGKGKKPVKGTKIKVHYIGKLLNGKMFDSSIDRGQPIEFEVGIGRVIKGWDEALLDMKKGEKRILIIPPNLAYGKKGAGSAIPPDATLIFEVELIDL